jgi:MtN3 and saliva related transmembrane protein
MDTKLFFDILQLLWGVILTSGYIPQIVKTFKTKDVNSFSMNYIVMAALWITLFQIYAIYLYSSTGQGIAFLITNTASWICASTLLVLVLMYRNNKVQCIPVVSDSEKE